MLNIKSVKLFIVSKAIAAGIIENKINFFIGVLFINFQTNACVVMKSIKIIIGKITLFINNALSNSDSNLITSCSGISVILFVDACCVN